MIDNKEKITEQAAPVESKEKPQTPVVSKNDESKAAYYEEGAELNRPRPNKDKFSLLSAQLNLPVPQRKGFVRQWVIDKELRVFEARDWRPVKGEDGQPMRIVMNHNTKEPEYGTYMEIPDRYFQDNLKADDAIRRDLVERRIQNKEIVDKDGKSLNTGNFYTPDAFTNKIERNNN